MHILIPTLNSDKLKSIDVSKGEISCLYSIQKTRHYKYSIVQFAIKIKIMVFYSHLLRLRWKGWGLVQMRSLWSSLPLQGIKLRKSVRQQRQKRISKLQEQRDKPNISDKLDIFQPLFPAGAGAPDYVSEVIVARLVC